MSVRGGGERFCFTPACAASCPHAVVHLWPYMHMLPAHTPSTKETCMLRHAPRHVLGHTPKISAGVGFALLPEHVLCQSPNLSKEQHMTPSRAQHAWALTFLVAPMLQATSPAIASPPLSASAPAELNTSSAIKCYINDRSPATPGAAYGISTLGVLTVGRPTATAATIMPSWASARLCCALEGLHVPNQCHCCLPPFGGQCLAGHLGNGGASHSLSTCWLARLV